MSGESMSSSATIEPTGVSTTKSRKGVSTKTKGKIVDPPKNETDETGEIDEPVVEKKTKQTKQTKQTKSKISKKNETSIETSIIDDVASSIENLVIDKKDDDDDEVVNNERPSVINVQRKPIVIELLNATKVQQFKSIFQNIKTFSKDINIHINKESLYIQSMDNSKVSIFELNLPSVWFDTWVVPVNCVVGILTSLFFNILNLSENNILIEYDPDHQSDKLSIELHLDKCNLAYELPLMDIESEILEIPTMDYMVDMKMKSAFFFNLVDKLKKFGGDSFDIECTEESVKLFVSTIESGKMSAEIKIEDLIEYAIGEEKTIGSFGMSYIYNIAVFYKVSDIVEIHFTDGQPIKILYNLGGIIETDDKACIVFYVAPKYDMNDD
jgi:proliferating cell nuclear antigen PCNA